MESSLESIEGSELPRKSGMASNPLNPRHALPCFGYGKTTLHQLILKSKLYLQIIKKVNSVPDQYLIECEATAQGGLLPPTHPSHLYKNLSLAVAVAAKSMAHPKHQEVRVVHIPSRAIVFRAPGRRKMLENP
jgi:hypothetical protein